MSIALPQVTVQHDFQTVISEVQEGIIPEEHFWISCYKQENVSVHGKVKVLKSYSDQVSLVSEQGVEFEKGEHSRYSVACPSLGIPSTRLRMPRQVLGDANQLLPQITSFDIAPDLSLYATGDADGNIHICSPSRAGQPLKSKPHISNILSLRFFPSSKVILTTSNDFALSVISAQDLSIPRTLKAHTRAVTDSAIISRGKNVLSCAKVNGFNVYLARLPFSEKSILFSESITKDGTIRLWDVGAGSQIHVMGSTSYSPVYRMSLGSKEPVIHQPPDGEIAENIPISVDSREIDTSDKAVFCALQNGSFEVFDLGSKSSFFRSEPASTFKSPLESIAYSSVDHMLATGSRGGVVTVYDTRQLSARLFSFQRNGASIEDMVFVSGVVGEVRLVVASSDGLPYVASVRPEGPHVVEELAGYDGDAVRSVKVVGGTLWTAGDDGLIRRY